MRTRMVLLRHALPDGAWHYDWMIERPEAGEGAAGRPGLLGRLLHGNQEQDARTLLTFRVHRRIDLREAEAFEAEQVEDHRVIYLEYEGEVRGGKGRVERVAEGWAEAEELSEKVVRVRCSFGGAAESELEGRRLEGDGSGDGRWAFRFVG